MSRKEPDFFLILMETFIGIDRVVSEPCDKLQASLEGLGNESKKDRHFGFTKFAGVREQNYEKGAEIRNYRQWSAVLLEDQGEIATAMDVDIMKAEWLGANLLFRKGFIVQELSFSQLPIGTQFVFPSGAVLVVYAENLPCKGPAEAMAKIEPVKIGDKSKMFGKAAMGKRGLVGWVERAGGIYPKDEVAVYLPRP